MSRSNWVKDDLPERYGALADTPRVMREALDALGDLNAAIKAIGEALIEAGLPRRAWQSDQVSLRLLSPTLPAISFGTFLARLERFATADGPAWLHGGEDDLAALHEEVSALARVTLPLREVVHRLQHLPVNMPGDARSEHPLQRVVRAPRLQESLDTAAEVLSDLEALAPFMRPLTQEQWRSLARAARPHPIRDAITALASNLTNRRRALAPSPEVTGAAASSGSGASRTRSLQWVPWVQRLTLKQRWLFASGVLIAVVAVVAALAFLRQPHPAQPALSSSAALTAVVGSGTDTASATETPASAPSPRATAVTAPQLTGSCVVHGATATLTLKNTGDVPLTWKAQPPQNLTIAPEQGTLQVGQSAVAQVSAQNKRQPTGTITLIASHGASSTEVKTPCR